MESFYKRALAAQKEGRWRDALALVKEGVSNDESMCMWLLGRCARSEYWGVTMSRTELISLYEHGAELGNTRCMLQLCIINYQNYIGKYRDKITFSDDNYTKGECYSLGFILPQHVTLAQRFLSQENDCFYYNSLAYLKRCVLRGPCNKEEELLKLSAEEGYAPGQVLLAFYYETGSPQYMYWLKKAADQQHIESFMLLAKEYLSVERYAAALYYLERIPGYSRGYIEKMRLLGQYEERFDMIRMCKSSCLTLVAVRKLRDSVLSVFPKEIVVLIAKALWKTCEEECWDVHRCNKRIKL